MNPRHSIGTPTARDGYDTHTQSVRRRRGVLRAFSLAPPTPLQAARRPSSISTHMSTVESNCHPPQMPSLRAHYRVQVRTVVFSGAQHLEVASGSISRNLNQIPIIASSRQHIAPVLDPSRLPSTPSPPWVRSVGLESLCVRCLGSTTSRPSGSLRQVRRRRSAQRA